jgi:hypothetical protein
MFLGEREKASELKQENHRILRVGLSGYYQVEREEEEGERGSSMPVERGKIASSSACLSSAVSVRLVYMGVRESVTALDQASYLGLFPFGELDDAGKINLNASICS